MSGSGSLTFSSVLHDNSSIIGMYCIHRWQIVILWIGLAIHSIWTHGRMYLYESYACSTIRYCVIFELLLSIFFFIQLELNDAIAYAW